MAYSIAYYIALTVYQIVDAYYTGPRDILIQTMIILLVGLELEIWTLHRNGGLWSLPRSQKWI